MPKKDERVNLRLAQVDKARFEQHAEQMRLSLSAWLTIAGLEKIDRERISTTESKANGPKSVKKR